jgi:hypothetical protein
MADSFPIFLFIFTPRRESGVLFGTRIRVRRPHIYEDAFSQMNNLGSRLKSRIQVSMLRSSYLPTARPRSCTYKASLSR